MNEEVDEIAQLLDDTVARLGAAKGDEQRVAQVIRQYLTDGSQLYMSPMELWDHFAISSPGLPERAGFDEPQTERAVELFSAEADQVFGPCAADDRRFVVRVFLRVPGLMPVPYAVYEVDRATMSARRLIGDDAAPYAITNYK